ncbi:hypothetical protein ACFO1B_30870 [Dactylosporangium siamense]|uniref:Uncharacterized protein n=1 Tax=Dactylosporangium siamense TaxID=685454 RepID=A0A919PNQ3_9ACTN|nr:hypothetical protein [Dactylosporangium siamense]GIG48120.1 hypothetical protein Dsi01nite_061610 [Dactylosporangium siamense]
MASAFHGLEIWLIGTSAELDAAVAALTGIGTHLLPDDPADHPQRHALHGCDLGRHRLYVRLSVAVAPDRQTTPRRQRAVPAGQDVIDLDAYRRTA